jgi:uncharacterized repeat protein (TIGR01451 family)
VTITYQVTVTTGMSAGSRITNTVRLGVEDQYVRFRRAAVVRVDTPDLSPSALWFSPSLARPGAVVTCTLALVNAGPGDALTATITNSLPVDAAFVPSSLAQAGGGTAEALTGTVRWTGPLSAGGQVTLTYQLTLPIIPGYPPLYSVAFLEDGTGGAWERAAWVLLEPLRVYLPLTRRNG